MNTEHGEIVWLDARCEVSLDELLRLSGLTETELQELVDYGALVPVGQSRAQWTFSGECVVSIQTAQRLRKDFDLDPNALSVALGLIERIRALEVELRALRAQMPTRFS
jgi:chaperone modulatory protein CbpM